MYGSLIAILLVIFKLTARDALEEFTNFVLKVFDDTARDPIKRTERLQQAIASILDKHGIHEGARLIPTSGPAPVRSKL